jgi:DNA-binding transcriptional regulator YdaS (Cro superfamily)
MNRPRTALADLLDDKGQKQAWLAKQLNLDPSSISRWVLGKRPIPPRYIDEIAGALRVDPQKLAPDADGSRR